MYYIQQGHHSAIRACINLGVFEKLIEGNGKSKTSSELAKDTNADPILLGGLLEDAPFTYHLVYSTNGRTARLLKHLAAMGSIHETGPNEYVSTPFSKALKEPIYRDAYPTMYCRSTSPTRRPFFNHAIRFEISGPAFFALPNYLSNIQYKNPDNPADGSFQLGHGTKSHFFEWVSQNPGRLEQFQNHMAGYRAGRPCWMDEGFFPVQANLVEGAKKDDDSVFLVDLGGGKGHDLQELNQKHPNIPGKLVLQELKGVIDEALTAGLDFKIESMAHDFFTPQPIVGM